MKKLAESEQSLDDQVAVLTRLMVMEVNRFLLVNKEPAITAEDIEPLFHDWAKFRARPDAAQHMQHWVLGKPLEDLPPPPEVVAPPAGETAETLTDEEHKQEFLEDDVSALEEAVNLQESGDDTGEHHDGAAIFGGDYAKSNLGNPEAGQGSQEHDASSKDDAVPVLPTQDTAVSDADASSSEVPEVSA